jgi:uncharacterized protein (TIGR00251 family)
MEVAILKLRVTPKASFDALVGWHGDALKVKVRAAPEDGRANAAVIELLARALELPRRTVTIEAGQASRDKRVRLEGITMEGLRARVSAALEDGG